MRASYAALAQQSMFVLNISEDCAPTCTPNKATTLTFDYLVSEAADLSYYP